MELEGSRRGEPLERTKKITPIAIKEEADVLTNGWQFINPDKICFQADPGTTNIRMYYCDKPANTFYIHTPTFITSFPRTHVPMDPLRPTATIDIDLNMKGAGDTQEAFKAWVDAIDDRYLGFMHQNQRILGKAGLSVEGVKALQKRQFRERISIKTGKKWPDAMVCHAKGFTNTGNKSTGKIMCRQGMSVIDHRTQKVFMVNMHDEPTDDDNAILSNDVVAVVLRFDGPYVSPGQYFGIGWTMVGAKTYGQAYSNQECSDVGSSLVLKFPNIDDKKEFPILCS